MRSGIHVFLTAPACDVWQLSRTLSPGGGQRAELGHTILNEPFLPPRREQWWKGSVVFMQGGVKKKKPKHQVTAFACPVAAACRCARVRDDDGGGTGNSIWGRGGCDNQAQEVISFDRVKCCTCLDYRAMTK